METTDRTPTDATAEPRVRELELHTPEVAALVRTDAEITHLPLWTRVVLYIVGTLFLILGVVGLFLPILQGVLFLLVGAAVLSVASETVYDAMYRLLHRRPKLWDRVHRFRARVHDRLARRRAPGDE